MYLLCIRFLLHYTSDVDFDNPTVHSSAEILAPDCLHGGRPKQHVPLGEV